MSENQTVATRDGWTRADLRDVATWEDAGQLVMSGGWHNAEGAVESAEELLGTGFRVCGKDELPRLINKPLVILSWRWNKGLAEYVSVELVTEDGEKLVVNSSGGIARQLREIETERHAQRPDASPELVRTNLICRFGVRLSEFDVETPDGATMHVRSWYLADAPVRV